MALRYRVVNWSEQKRLYDGLMLLGIALYVGIFLLSASWIYPDSTAETLLIRAFGTAALLLFHLTLMIGPLSRLDTRFLPLLYNRRHMGVTTFLLGLIHGSLALIQFHALGDKNPIVSVFISNPNYDSLRDFPFQTLGLTALVILFLLASTSHDFWMKTLTPPVWKALHMLAYPAWFLLIIHVCLGVLQVETSLVPVIVLLLGVTTVVSLHLAAGLKERRIDSTVPDSNDGFVATCPEADLEEGWGKSMPFGEDRVALYRSAGKVYAVSNVCPHQNGPLGEGRIVQGCITCPWHGYQFYPETGRAPAPYKDNIETYQVKIEDGMIWVSKTPCEVQDPELSEDAS